MRNGSFGTGDNCRRDCRADNFGRRCVVVKEIKVMQFERSDVLRQRRLKNQLTVKEFRDELLFRRNMTGGVIVTLTMLGFLAGEITASILL